MNQPSENQRFGRKGSMKDQIGSPLGIYQLNLVGEHWEKMLRAGITAHEIIHFLADCEFNFRENLIEAPTAFRKDYIYANIRDRLLNLWPKIDVIAASPKRLPAQRPGTIHLIVNGQNVTLNGVKNGIG